MPLSLRPLLSVSVLTLLGWCWYSFRRSRKAKAPVLVKDKVHGPGGNNLARSSHAEVLEKRGEGQSIRSVSDLKMDQIPKSSKTSECVVTSSVQLCTSTATPLSKGVRPEPEGEVSIRFPETLQNKHRKDYVDEDCGDSAEDDSTSEFDSAFIFSLLSSGNQTGLSDFCSEMNQNQENIESSQLAADDEVVHEKDSQDPLLQQSFRETDERRESLHNPSSFREKLLSHAGEDSGCGSCFSEDVSSEERQSWLLKQTESDRTSANSALIHSSIREDEDEEREDLWRGPAVESSSGDCPDPQIRNLSPPPALPIIIWDIEVPAHLVGRLIGKQGKFVNFLKQNSGAKIYISTLPFTQDFQICHIQGSQQQVDDALTLIRKKFKDLDLKNCAPLPCLPITSWLLLPEDVFVEVLVVKVEAAHHIFVQQYRHPSHQVLPTLTQAMQLCYTQPGCPSLPSPIEAGVVCAAPVKGRGWQRAQVIQYHSESGTAHIRYVDIGGYDAVNSETLRQIRSDFVTLPFQAAEVLLDNIVPLPGKEIFSPQAKAALEESTANMPLVIKVVLLNRSLAEQGLCSWLESQ
ncbi:hypothetical protein DNTS_026123 [Danionella cerebrum]|uniref:Tudor domain-containing protein n=1 Tax=Danionella cerebrum TaxID=2873325 RepID=A0A553QQN4_9TELE|nr:hypothetical protein DNTS_026123 [Danionella translucida]